MLSKRSDVDPFLAMEIVSQAKALENQGHDIVHMEVGQPASAAPLIARENLRARLDEVLGYTESLGIYELRAKIAQYYQKAYEVEIAPERVIITTGSSTGFQLAFLALLNEGDRVGIADPGYPSYRNILKALSLRAHRIEGQRESQFQPSVEQISRADMDALLLASPANPTGAILRANDMQALIAKAQSENIALIFDEIYHGISYGKPTDTALKYSDDVIVIQSFSKYFSLTGWRIGWMIVPENMVRVFEKLSQNLYICPPHISQIAALYALDGQEECEDNVKIYAKNREYLMQEFPKIGLGGFSPPDGAFYLYVDVSALCEDSRDLVQSWLKIGVAATPGWDFDPVRGGQFVRFSYAQSPERIKEGVRRLRAWYE